MNKTLHLKFFASLREKLGNSGETIILPEHINTAGQVREYLMTRDTVWTEALSNTRALRMAYNQQMIDADALISDGGELAFFPPVTGG
jgi:molybdopterin synthase sulfur carrier subunit